MAEFFAGHYPSASRELRPNDPAPDRRGRNPNLRIVTNALHFARVGVGEDIKLPIFLSEPDGREYRYTSLAKRSQGNVFVSAQLTGDR